MNTNTMTTKLPVFKITYNNGSSYVTSMAEGITIDQAKEYFLNQSFVQSDETTFLTVVKVDQI